MNTITDFFHTWWIISNYVIYNQECKFKLGIYFVTEETYEQKEKKQLLDFNHLFEIWLQKWLPNFINITMLCMELQGLPLFWIQDTGVVRILLSEAYGSLSSIEINNIKKLCYLLFEDYHAKTNGMTENSTEMFNDKELNLDNLSNFLSNCDS